MDFLQRYHLTSLAIAPFEDLRNFFSSATGRVKGEGQVMEERYEGAPRDDERLKHTVA